MRRLLFILLLPVLLPLGCARDQKIVVGAKAFTEGYLLGHMAAILLEDAGYSVEEQFGVKSSAMRSALESGQVDLYFEYTGTAYTVYAHGADPAVMSDSARVLQAVREFDRREHDLVWLAPIPFDNTYTLLMRRADSERRGITSLSDLSAALARGERLVVAVDAEFRERPDGLKAMLKRYGFPEIDVTALDAGLIYGALAEGGIDVGMGYSTDGQIPALDLVSLADDRRFFPAYNPAAVVRAEALARRPGIRDVLEDLNRRLDTETIRRLNAEVNMKHRDPRKVAMRFLRGLPQEDLP